MAVSFGKDGTVYCDTIRYNYKQVRNLVADGTGAVVGGTGAWDVEFININTSLPGTFRFNTGHAMMRQSMPMPEAGHKYYGALLWSLAAGATTGDNRFEWYSGDGDNEKMVFAYKGAVGGRYVLLSSIQSLSTPKTGAAGAWSIRNFCTSLSAVGTCKNIMIVDLTDAFGAGNEPTKEWCDQNIIEHNLLNNVGDEKNFVPTTSNYTFGSDKYYTQGSLGRVDCYNYKYWSSRFDVRDYMWLIGGSSGAPEGYIYSTNTSYVSNGETQYFQIFGNPYSASYTDGKVSLQCYQPIAEPSMGTTPVVLGENFNMGGGLSGWKKYSLMRSNSSFSSGAYQMRFDFNNLYTTEQIYLTNLFLTSVESQIFYYNANINNGNDIAIGDVNKYWCERWIGGPLNSIIHIKDPYNTVIKIGGRSEIEQLKFIESKGTQYIDTGLVSSDNITKIEAHYYHTEDVNNQILFGMYTGSQFCYMDYREGSSTMQCSWHNQTVNSGVHLGVGEYKTSMERKDGKIIYTVNGTTVSIPDNNGVPSGSTAYYLFADNNVGSPIYQYRARLYSFKVWVDGELVRDYTPVLWDGLIALYESVEGYIYTNNTLGTFKQGNVVPTTISALADGYERLKYIEATGTQWIQTGLKASDFTTRIIKSSINISPSAGSAARAYSTWIGCQQDLQYLLRSDYGKLCVFGGSGINYPLTLSDNRRYTINFSVDYNNGSIRSRINRANYSYSGTNFGNNTVGIMLFASHNGGSPWTDELGLGRLYYCRFYDGDRLIRDFIPARRKSDGAIGLYDTVTKQFYNNSGTGTFAYGTIASANPTDYDIMCNDVEIRPEQNKITFTRTGTIICKRLVKNDGY